MNNKKVNKLIPKALDALKDTKECRISEDGRTINSAYRSAISAFGAAITTGSLKAAVAVFSKDAEEGKAGIERSKLICTIYYIAYGNWINAKEVLKEVINSTNEREMRESFINAAVALKLAMNAFELKKPNEQGDGVDAKS